jgi:hypothetical protein
MRVDDNGGSSPDYFNGSFDNGLGLRDNSKGHTKEETAWYVAF